MPSRSYDHLLSFALSHPWALQREMLAVIAGILARRLAGQETDPAVLAAALVNRKNLPQPAEGGGVAIIPVYGVLAPRMNLLSEMSGGTTFETLTGQLREVMANKAVKTIVLDVDSPGGNVAGATEFAREVMKARTRKPVLAQIQYTGASAAYWIAAAATEIIAAPSARVGSIGVYTAHDDLSEALAKEGIKRTYIAAGDGKVHGFENEPLSTDALARITALVEEAYGRFVSDVVHGRGKGVTAETVKTTWKAALYGAPEALSLGMIDQIATLDETLARLRGASPEVGRLAAAAPSCSTLDTTQEPPATVATVQDRTSDHHLERRVFELQL